MKVNSRSILPRSKPRALMGLPDLTPLHDQYLETLKDTMKNGISPDLAESVIRSWSSTGEAGMGILAATAGGRRQGRLTVHAHRMTDTIFAVSSGAPPAAIAVLRISGPNAFTAGARLARSLPLPRRAALRRLRDGDVELDRGLVIVFPGVATATGEDLLELHLHGGRAIVRAVEAALGRQPGLRPAEPGEFTRRALANGVIDLAQAEGFADLLSAENECAVATLWPQLTAQYRARSLAGVSD